MELIKSNQLVHLSDFDVANYLDDEEAIAMYLKLASSGPPEHFAQAIRDVKRARLINAGRALVRDNGDD